MRPLRLILDGFTSYRKPQEIDFSDFGLFVITGSTGSGKSSILDAISFALYGSVPRLGERDTKPVISLGLPMARLELEFKSGGNTYKVARRVYRERGGEAILERKAGAVWMPEAGQVRQVNDKIAAIVGLDFVSFTRAVLLPQGAFDRFLKASASERTDILRSLLDIGKFEKAGQLVRSRASEDHHRLTSINERLVEEFGDVTVEHLASLRADLKGLVEKEKTVQTAKKTANGLLDIITEKRSKLQQTDVVLEELRSVQSALSHLATQLSETSPVRDQLNAEATQCQDAIDLAEATVEDVQRVRAEMTASHGTPDELHSAKERLMEWVAASSNLSEAQSKVEAHDLKKGPMQAKALETKQAVSAAKLAVATAKQEEEAGARKLEEARIRDAADGIRVALRTGDACPVCGAEYSADSHVASHGQVGEYAEALKQAQQKAELSVSALRDAESELVALETRIQEHTNAGVELANEHSRKFALLEATVPEYRAVAKRDPDSDDLTAIEAAITQFRGLDTQAREAAAAVESAKLKMQRVKERLAESDRNLAAMQQALSDLWRRARQSVGDVEAMSVPDPSHSTLENSGYLSSECTRAEKAVVQLSSGLREEVAKAEGKLSQLLNDCGIDPGERGLIQETAVLIERHLTLVQADISGTHQRIELLQQRLKKRVELKEQQRDLRTRVALHEELGRELRSSAFPNFILQESLQHLAVLASKQLIEISGHRYSLDAGSGDFEVIDHANADERRGVATLSGGETFLASLSLALALSQSIVQVSGETANSKLEAIFIDEGFGSLDPETLDGVVDTLEMLREGDRMIGVITHVGAMAERIADGLRVDGGDSGSTVNPR